jgi:hypothetical protein
MRAAAYLAKSTDKLESLKTVLCIIIFQRYFQPFHGSLLSIPWYEHLKRATKLARELALPSRSCGALSGGNATMGLIACLDILGSSVLGRAPDFAKDYLHCYISKIELGLHEVWGCSDEILYLISEVACLASLLPMAASHLTYYADNLISHIRAAERISKRPTASSSRITAAFRLAAIIYVSSLVPGFHPGHEACLDIVSELVPILASIPGAPNGSDRSLVWVYLVCGSVSLATSPFRSFFVKRFVELSNASPEGCHGSLDYLDQALREVWRVLDEQSGETCVAGFGLVSRVMRNKGWQFLLM